MYNWEDVADRAEIVYHQVKLDKPLPIINFIENSLSRGFVGVGFLILMILEIFLLWILDIILPKRNIEKAIDFNKSSYITELENSYIEKKIN